MAWSNLHIFLVNGLATRTFHLKRHNLWRWFQMPHRKNIRKWHLIQLIEHTCTWIPGIHFRQNTNMGPNTQTMNSRRMIAASLQHFISCDETKDGINFATTPRDARQPLYCSWFTTVRSYPHDLKNPYENIEAREKHNDTRCDPNSFFVFYAFEIGAEI